MNLVPTTLYGKSKAFVVLNIESSGQPGTRWLSGFSGTSSAIIVTTNHRILLTDGRYASQALQESSDWERFVIDRSGIVKALAKKLTALDIQRISIDSTRTSHDMITELAHLIPDSTIIPSPNTLHEMRLVKTSIEVSLIQKANAIAIHAFKNLLETIRSGMTERQLAYELEYLMKKAGADGIAFDTICISGERTALPHGKPSDKAITKGDLITFDFGAIVGGYCSDITRTIALEEPSTQLLEIYAVVREAHERGCKAVRAGMTGRDIDAVCRDYIASKGYGEYFLHSTGHGLGMEVHELPNINYANDTPLPAGAVITCEPGIYIEGLGGVRIEDDLLVTQAGSVNLTASLSKKLMVL